MSSGVIRVVELNPRFISGDIFGIYVTKLNKGSALIIVTLCVNKKIGLLPSLALSTNR